MWISLGLGLGLGWQPFAMADHNQFSCLFIGKELSAKLTGLGPIDSRPD